MVVGARKAGSFGGSHAGSERPGEPIAALIRQTAGFGVLDPAQQAAAAAAAVLRRFDKGDIIVHHGANWPRALLVVEGTLRMVKGSPEGRVLAAVTLGPGNVFFGHSLFDGQPMPASLEAETPGACYLWDEAVLTRLFRNNATALWDIAGSLTRQMRRAAGVIDNLAFQPLTRRLARLLLDSYPQAGPEPAPRTLTLEEMAARLGSTREVVCRLLYRMADDGLINITRTEFAFRDRRRLSQLADSDTI